MDIKIFGALPFNLKSIKNFRDFAYKIRLYIIYNVFYSIDENI